MPSPCPRVGPSAVTRPGRQLEPHSCRGGHRALFTLLEANPLCRVARRSSALPLSRSRFLGCRITAAPELLKIFLAARCRDKTERRGCCGEGRLAISTTVRSENILPPPACCPAEVVLLLPLSPNTCFAQERADPI